MTTLKYLQPRLCQLKLSGMRDAIAARTEEARPAALQFDPLECLALCSTTNRDPANLYPLFPNPLLAEGLLDRLLHSAYVVTMAGRSYRPTQRPQHQEVARWRMATTPRTKPR